MKCAYHPNVETNLRCGKCGKPICPKDIVQTPVGVRCPDCARLRKIPTYQVTPSFYLRAAGSGLAAAIVCGILWALIDSLIGLIIGFSFNLLWASAVGYTIGEVVSRATNRKRGTVLMVIAGVAVVTSYFVSILFFTILLGIPFYWALPQGAFSIGYDILAIALGIYVAVTRVR